MYMFSFFHISHVKTIGISIIRPYGEINGFYRVPRKGVRFVGKEYFSQRSFSSNKIKILNLLNTNIKI